MQDLVNISVSATGAYALLGYAVVFLALVLLMCVVYIVSAVMKKSAAKAAPAGSIPAPADDAPIVTLQRTGPVAPGSAGELKLYDTDPRVAATLMAIVADELQTPINELRFLSIKEIKEDNN